MTLYPCPQCSNSIARTATICPHCGHERLNLARFCLKTVVWLTLLCVFVVGLWHVKCLSLLKQELPDALRRQARECSSTPLAGDWPKITIDPVTNVVSIDLHDNEGLTASLRAMTKWIIGKERYEAIDSSFHNSAYPNLDQGLEQWARHNVDFYAMVVPYRVKWQ